MKQFTSIIKVEFVGNVLEAEDEEDYREKLKDNFYRDFGIVLTDEEIEITDEESVK